ncbi:uncharacterized protein DUF736, partial [Rhizobium sp. PP-CC-3G-465]
TSGSSHAFSFLFRTIIQATSRRTDPSFPAPIYATLIEVEGEDGYQLIWSRQSRD